MKGGEQEVPEEKQAGKITHYFGNLGVGVVELSGVLKKGDQIHIKGATTDFEQIAESMQIDGKDIDQAKKGDAIGVKFNEKVRQGDLVLKK
ncbi:MAG: translation elongation factor-like protein [bacterium]